MSDEQPIYTTSAKEPDERLSYKKMLEEIKKLKQQYRPMGISIAAELSPPAQARFSELFPSRESNLAHSLFAIRVNVCDWLPKDILLVRDDRQYSFYNLATGAGWSFDISDALKTLGIGGVPTSFDWTAYDGPRRQAEDDLKEEALRAGGAE